MKKFGWMPVRRDDTFQILNTKIADCPPASEPPCPTLPPNSKLLPRIAPVCASREYCKSIPIAESICPLKPNPCFNYKDEPMPKLRDVDLNIRSMEAYNLEKKLNVNLQEKTSVKEKEGGSKLIAADVCDSTTKIKERLTGYKTLPYALPIPKYMGFRPLFAHPYPPIHRHQNCDTKQKVETKTHCPLECQSCEVREKYTRDFCTSQLHPYKVPSQAEKITRTW